MQLSIDTTTRQTYGGKSSRELRELTRNYGFNGTANAHATKDECMFFLSLIDGGTTRTEARRELETLINERRNAEATAVTTTAETPGLYPLSSAVAHQDARKSTSAAPSIETAIAQLMASLAATSTPPAPEINPDMIATIARSEVEKALAVLNRPQPVYHVYKTEREEFTSPSDAIVPEFFPRLVGLCLARLNVMLVGPSGCGKTEICSILARTLNQRFAFLSLSAGITESHLLGRYLPTGENGRFEFNPALFVDYYENGGVFLLDEMDAADANVLLVINSAIANGHLAISERKENPIATKHPDFILIAAANTYGTGADRQFVGRNQLDAATLDRFFAIACDYSSAVEDKLIRPDVLSWGRTRRAQINNAGLRRSISTRFMLSLCKAIATAPELFDNKAFWDEQLTAAWTRDEKARIS